MSGYFQLLGKLTSCTLLVYFIYRTFIKSDKPAALILMLGLMIIAEDYLQFAVYLPGLEAGSIRYSELIILFLLFKKYRNPKKYDKFESRTIDTLWIPFIILFLISVYISSYSYYAARNFRWSVLDPFLIYLIACDGFDSENDYKMFVTYLGILVFILAAASIDDLKFHRIWFEGTIRSKYEFFGKEMKGRYGSFFLNPNFFASFLILSLPVMLISSLYFKGRAKYILMLSILAGALALIITYTRAAYAAIAAGALFGVYYGLFKVIKLKKILSVLFVIVCLVWTIFPGFLNKILHRAETIKGEAEQSRLVIWGNALQLLKRHPFIGVGLTEGDYRLEARKFSGQKIIASRQGTVVSGFMDQPHNSYISLALWVSPLSVIIYLMMNFNLLKLGRKILKNPSASTYFKVFSFSVGTAIFCYLVIIFFDTQLLLRTVNSLYWILFGLLVSIYRRVESEKRQPQKNESK